MRTQQALYSRGCGLLVAAGGKVVTHVFLLLPRGGDGDVAAAAGGGGLGAAPLRRPYPRLLPRRLLHLLLQPLVAHHRLPALHLPRRQQEHWEPPVSSIPVFAGR